MDRLEPIIILSIIRCNFNQEFGTFTSKIKEQSGTAIAKYYSLEFSHLVL